MLRNLHFVLLLLLFLVTSCKESGTTTATQFDVPMLSAEGQDAYKDIDTITYFCSEHIGIGGRTPSVVWSFRELLKEDLSAEAFKGLLQSANTAGKLYALCGL